MPLLLDVTSLALRRNAGAMTGIDRIEYALSEWLLSHSEEASTEVGFVLNLRWARGILNRSAVAQLLDACRRERLLDAPAGDTLVALFSILAKSPDQPGQTGATKVSAAEGGKKARLAHRSLWRDAVRGSGTFAGMLRREGSLRYVHASHYGLQWPQSFAWISRRKVAATFYVHDLIPIDFPQFCSPGAHRSHKLKLATVARCAQRVVVNSEHTRDRLVDWLTENRLPVPQLEVCRPAAQSFAGLPDPASVMLELPEPGPYYLCAGTLEGRKNLPLLLAAWRMLSRRLPANRMPRLVLAGQRGWSADEVLRDLDTMRDIAPYVIEAHGLNDAELSIVMHRARSVIKPSLAEGFSLVPAQALVDGVPVLLSDIPAHRELVRELGGRAAFFDPTSPEALCDLLEAEHVPALIARAGPAQTARNFALSVLGDTGTNIAKGTDR